MYLVPLMLCHSFLMSLYDKNESTTRCSGRGTRVPATFCPSSLSSVLLQYPKYQVHLLLKSVVLDMLGPDMFVKLSDCKYDSLFWTRYLKTLNAPTQTQLLRLWSTKSCSFSLSSLSHFCSIAIPQLLTSFIFENCSCFRYVCIQVLCWY